MKDLKRATDENLIGMLNNSSELAFNEIYNRYWSRLLVQAKYHLKNDPESEECVQDVFLKLWNNRKNLSLDHKFSTYLYRAVKNQVINLIEKRLAKKNDPALLAHYNQENAGIAADRLVIEKELLAALEASINALPAKCELIFRMSREEGKSNRQIGAELGISEKTVEAHLTRAIKRVSKDMAGAIVLAIVLTTMISN